VLAVWLEDTSELFYVEREAIQILAIPKDDPFIRRMCPPPLWWVAEKARGLAVTRQCSSSWRLPLRLHDERAARATEARTVATAGEDQAQMTRAVIESGKLPSRSLPATYHHGTARRFRRSFPR